MAAYIKALEDVERLLRVWAGVSGDAEDAKAAIAAEFKVSDVAGRCDPGTESEAVHAECDRADAK